MVQTFSTQGPDESFDDRIRTRACYGRGDGVDTDPSGPLAEVAAIDHIMIMEQMAWLGAPRRGLDQLSPHPGRSRVGGDVRVQQFPPAVSDEHQDVERLEGFSDIGVGCGCRLCSCGSV